MYRGALTRAVGETDYEDLICATLFAETDLITYAYDGASGGTLIEEGIGRYRHWSLSHDHHSLTSKAPSPVEEATESGSSVNRPLPSCGPTLDSTKLPREINRAAPAIKHRRQDQQ